ncbi:MAG: type II toxin-antitoxin system VapC family toxin [Magnetococcales bacterium]|nr:type II toxin-antitoxin system VapC family toxin [Magnetococcales bacterium]
MKLLMDTHTFLWWVWEHPNLSDKTREVMTNPENDLFLSMASIWEMAIKISMGRLALTKSLDCFISDHMERNQFTLLDISIAHASRVVSLPFHHRDPFDRLLIAQAMEDGMPILSVDGSFDAYGITRIG